MSKRKVFIEGDAGTLSLDKLDHRFMDFINSQRATDKVIEVIKELIEENRSGIPKKTGLEAWKKIVKKFRQKILSMYEQGKFSKPCEQIVLPLLSNTYLDRILDVLV